MRHAQSAGNASGLIDTSTPGPDLIIQGVVPSDARGSDNWLANHYDGIYASTMIRTQETATPTSQVLGEPITVLPGLREIEAGQYEGAPEADIPQTYFAAPGQVAAG